MSTDPLRDTKSGLAQILKLLRSCRNVGGQDQARMMIQAHEARLTLARHLWQEINNHRKQTWVPGTKPKEGGKNHETTSIR